MTGALATALFASALLGIVCGLLGTFVVVRRMALTGDMISHAVLPGVVAGLSWSSSRDPLLVLGFAVIAGLAGSGAMNGVLRYTRLKPDVALAMVLSVFFAVGIAMISRLQPPGVHAFLYGQVAAIDRADLRLLAIVTIGTLVLIPLSFRSLTATSFDPAFSRLLGIRVKLAESIFFLLLTGVIVIAMQAVGVVLVTAMLVTPAAAARFCTASLGKMTWLACLFGAAGGLAGVLVSSAKAGLPTGPLIALAVTTVFVFAAILGTRSGWLPALLRRKKERARISGEDFLKKIWLAEELPDKGEPSAGSATGDFSSAVPRRLLKNGLIAPAGSRFTLTESGREIATRLVRSHRLWEKYLAERAAYKTDHVHDSAERIEHWMDEESRRRLEKRLGNPERDPHGSPIPPAPGQEEAPR